MHCRRVTDDLAMRPSKPRKRVLGATRRQPSFRFIPSLSGLEKPSLHGLYWSTAEKLLCGQGFELFTEKEDWPLGR